MNMRTGPVAGTAERSDHRPLFAPDGDGRTGKIGTDCGRTFCQRVDLGADGMDGHWCVTKNQPEVTVAVD